MTAAVCMFQQYHLYSMDMSGAGDELLDSHPALVCNMLQSNSVSPTTFSTQLVRKLGLKGHDNYEAEAANLNNKNIWRSVVVVHVHDM